MVFKLFWSRCFLKTQISYETPIFKENTNKAALVKVEGLRVTPSTPFPRPSTGQLLRAPGFETQPCLSFTAGKARFSLATETQRGPGPRFVTPGSLFAALCHVHATPETVLMALTKCNFILTIFVQAFDFLIWKHTKHYSLIHHSTNTHLLSNSHVPGTTTQGRNKRAAPVPRGLTRQQAGPHDGRCQDSAVTVL